MSNRFLFKNFPGHVFCYFEADLLTKIESPLVKDSVLDMKAKILYLLHENQQIDQEMKDLKLSVKHFIDKRVKQKEFGCVFFGGFSLKVLLVFFWFLLLYCNFEIWIEFFHWFLQCFLA